MFYLIVLKKALTTIGYENVSISSEDDNLYISNIPTEIDAIEIAKTLKLLIYKDIEYKVTPIKELFHCPQRKD